MYQRLEHVSVTCIIGQNMRASHVLLVRTCERHMYYRSEHVSVTCIIGQNM